MIPGLNKKQTLIAIAMLKLVTRGDVSEEDWKFLYAQYETIPAAKSPKTQKTFEEFRAALRGEAPAFLHHLLFDEHKSPPPFDLSQN